MLYRDLVCGEDALCHQLCSGGVVFDHHSNHSRVVQGLWIGPRLSLIEELSIRSFLAHGHEYHLYAYGKIQNVPEGAVLKDANEICPSTRIFKYRDHDSYSGFSNYFRYKLLGAIGGWWADLDLICLKPFDFDGDYVFSSEDPQPFEGNNRRMNVGAIKAPACSPLMEHLCEVCENKNPSDLVWGEIGPCLFSEGVHKFGMECHVKEPAVFCPIPWFRWKDAIDPDVRLRLTEETYAVHLWNEMWRREGFDKDDEYDPACLYERLKATYFQTPVWRQPAKVYQTRLNHARKAVAASPTVSALVLSKNGSGRLGRCLESIQRTGFADEIVVCVDADTTDDSFRLARSFTSNVHVTETSGYIESALSTIAGFCSCDFVLRIDDDESLAGNWDKASFRLQAASHDPTQVWVPRRWVIPPGDSFIAGPPWCPDLQPRLHVNDPDKIIWPKHAREQIRVLGRCITMLDRWINHYYFVDRPKGERRRRCAKYRESNPKEELNYYDLYEDTRQVVLPCDTSATEFAVHLEGPHLSGYERYSPGSPVDFSTKGNSVRYLGNGWGEAEKWGTWTVGDRAEISLPIAAPLGSGAVLSVVVMPYLNSRCPRLRVDVFYGEARIGQWWFKRPGFVTLSVNIAADLISSDTQPRLIFGIPEARSPLDAGESSDPRLLGLGFKSLRLQRLDEEPKAGSKQSVYARRTPPKEAFVDKAVNLGRQALPGVEIEAFWEGLWIFRVAGHYFPLPEVAEPECIPWQHLAGLASQYLRDAEDYWYFGYRPRLGDVVVDIGAGRGEDTFAFSRSVGDAGRVFAIEPHPVSFAVLSKFCRFNELSNVTALNFACVTKSGQLQIETLPNWQSNYVTERDATPTSFPVEGLSFDYIWRRHGIGRIDLLKMNIEGAERDALVGARVALEQVRNVVIAAHDFRADRGEDEWFRTGAFVREFLMECGFRIKARHDSRAWARDHIHGTKPD